LSRSLLLASAALWLTGCDVTLARGLRAEEADQLSARLNERGVAATKLDESAGKPSYRIEIGPDSVEAALAALASGTSTWSRDEAAAPADDAPLVPTKSDQQLRAGRALGRDLARSIELLPGVLRARVHVSFPAPSMTLEDPAGPPQPAPSVAVLLLLTAAARSSALDDQVRTLVAGAVPGRAASAIAIVASVQGGAAVGCAELARIGPVSVTRNSESTLKAWLALALSVHMLLAAALLFVLTRARRKPSLVAPP
jgi:type III secretory pathway lipoprotein EscJ